MTEILEMLAPAGHTPLSLWMTTVWHPIIAAGFWGLHKAQSSGQNNLSLAAVVAVMIAFLAFAPLSAMFLNSGEVSIEAFVEQRPFFKAAGFLMLIGLVLFAMGVIRSRYYPAWMAWGVIAAVALVAIKTAGGFPDLVQHAGFILLSLMVIGMAMTGLRKSRPLRA